MKFSYWLLKLKIWITTVGWSKFAVINTIWAACFNKEEQFIPEKVILLHNGHENPDIAENVADVIDWVRRILKVYGIDNPIFEEVPIREAEINSYRDIYLKLINKIEKDKECINETAIDLTPGRKFMSSIAMAVGLKKRKFIKKLYYLHLNFPEYLNYPYIKIPFVFQKLINILEIYDDI